MKAGLFPLVIIQLIPLLVLSADGPAPHRLEMAFDTPRVEVQPRAAGREFLSLPRLDYQFRLQPRCAADWLPATLSISVADSRLSFGREALAGRESHPVSLAVPAAQIAPLPVSGFCQIANDPAGPLAGATDDDSTLTIRAALSAHAALLCANGDQQRITYIAQPLDVTLVCSDKPDEAAR